MDTITYPLPSKTPKGKDILKATAPQPKHYKQKAKRRVSFKKTGQAAIQNKNFTRTYMQKKVREKSRECNNHKQQPFPETKRKRKQTKPKKHKSNKHMKITKISSLFPKRGNRNAKRTEKQKNKITHGKT